MTLLTLCRDVANEVGVDSPASVVNNNDETAKRLYTLANSSGRRLARKYDWQALQKEGSFTTVADESQGTLSSIASDYNRMARQSVYNRGDSREIVGNIGGASWQYYKAKSTGGLYDRFRIRGNEVLIFPTPTAGETVYFEYISKNWAQSSGGINKDSFTEDTDIPLLDEDLMRLDMIWRYRSSLGLEYKEEKAEFNEQYNLIAARDVPPSDIDISGSESYPYSVGIPNGSMPQ